MPFSWAEWSKRVEAALRDDGVQRHIEKEIPIPERLDPSSSPPPTAEELSARKEMRKKLKSEKALAKHIIFENLDNFQLSLIMEANTPFEAWGKLRGIYVRTDIFSISRLYEDFFTVRMVEGEKLATFWSRVQKIVKDLEEVGEKQSDNALLAIMLSRLLPKFETITLRLRMSTTITTSGEVWKRLLAEEQRMDAGEEERKRSM
eukprot:TRINITY_DN576_c2_g1_i1.p1 TRINITY_DN576_c2_g1~~TRINITY_DN576_c2_g1_i1.p1  ORF type:complete len:204 (+),score=41.01 TRINITY_DN576_c2_g1_i1:393-1004(+)